MKLAVVLAVVALAGCSSKKREPRVEPAPEVAAPVAAAPEPVVVAPAPVAPAVVVDDSPPADFPAECLAYAALVDKASTCDALGGARDGLVNAYRELRAGWPHVPQAQRASVATQCKAQADSLRAAAAATCQL